MSSEKADVNAYKNLGHCYVSHQDAPPSSDRSDRATRALSGQLVPNPPFVELSFQVSDDPTAKVLGVAISPKGKVAIAVLTNRLSLVTYDRGSVSSRVFPGSHDVAFAVRPFFPEGSEDAAVLIDGTKILWGNWTVELPWGDRSVNKYDCLTAWLDDGIRKVAFIDKSVAWECVPGKKGSWQDTYTWLGLVDGSLARIKFAEKNGSETLYWCDLSVPAQVSTTDFAGISNGSVASKDGGIQFNAHIRGENVAVWTDGVKRHEVPVPGQLRLERGEIYSVNQLNVSRFEKDRFVVVGIGAPYRGTLPLFTGFDRFGDTTVLSDFSRPGEASDKRLFYIDRNGAMAEPNTRNDSAYARFHHGVGLLRKGRNDEPTLHWEVPLADGHQEYADFPLYNVPFATLVPVEDVRGKAVMAALNPEGSATMVIIRYPLPKG